MTNTSQKCGCEINGFRMPWIDGYCKKCPDRDIPTKSNFPPCRPMHKTNHNHVTRLKVPMPDVRIYDVPKDLTDFQLHEYQDWLKGKRPATFNGATE